MVSSKLQRLCHLLARRAVRNVHFIISASYQRSAFTLMYYVGDSPGLRLLHHLLHFYIHHIWRRNATDQDVGATAKWWSRVTASRQAASRDHSRRQRANELSEQTARRQAAGDEYIHLRRYSRHVTVNFEAMLSGDFTNTDNITFVHAFWS